MKKAKTIQNDRKKRLGNLVTGILNSFGESSAENLSEYVRIRPGQPMDHIRCGVRRTLDNGMRLGFLMKRKNKYSLAGRTHQTDCIPWQYDENFKACEKAKVDLKCSQTGERICRARNLITFVQCKSATGPLKYLCTFHGGLRYYLLYKKLFFTTLSNQIHSNTPLMIFLKKGGAFKKLTKKPKGITRDMFTQYQDTACLNLIHYATYYSNFIFYFNNLFIGSILSRFRLPKNRFNCNGLLLTNPASYCTDSTTINKPCKMHFQMHALTKCFTHPKGFSYANGLSEDAIEMVFADHPTITTVDSRAFHLGSNVSVAEVKRQLKAFITPKCIDQYLAIVSRLDDQAIVGVKIINLVCFLDFHLIYLFQHTTDVPFLRTVYIGAEQGHKECVEDPNCICRCVSREEMAKRIN